MNADALLHWLQRTSLEASLLILAVLGLRVALGNRLSPGWRLGLWLLVGLKLLVPACIPAGWGLGMLGRGSGDRMDLVDRSDTRTAVPEFQAAVPSLARDATPAPPASLSVEPGVLGVWLLGCFSVLGVALLRQRRFHRQLATRPLADDPQLLALLNRLAAQARVPAPRIRLTAPGTPPALVGLRRPTLLLPCDWPDRFSDRSLRHVLLHELLHIRHHDLFWNWLATAVQALHWFNPLVGFVVSRFQADRELRCDAGALAILAPGERLEYGRTLLRIQESFFAPPSLAGLAPCVRHHPTLRQRLLMITTPTRRQPALQVLLALTLSVLAGYSFTTARAAEKEAPPKIREGSATQPSDRSDTSDRATPKREAGNPSAERDGEKKPGPRDGDRPRSGARDGDRPRTGPRDSGKPSAETGRRPSPEADARSADGEVLPLHVTAGGDTVVIGGEKIPANRLRGFLSGFLPQHPGARVEVSGDGDIPLKVLHNVVDAVRDNGNRNVGIKAE